MKPKPPQLELEDMIDIRSLSHEELLKVPYEPMWWHCGVDGCTAKCEVRFYGQYPYYYWARRKEWINIETTFRYCDRHGKMYKDFFRKKPGAKEPENICRCMPIPKLRS